MNTVTAPEPLVHEDNLVLDQDDEYAAWLRAELERRIANPGREIPHAEVMAEITTLIASKRQHV